MKKISFLILLFIGLIGHSQCPTGNVTLNTQADVDNFQINYPNCTVIDGDLTVGGLDITDLTPLINITQVTGTFHLTGCGMASLNGLQNLTSVGTTNGQNMFMIGNNQNLQDMSQLYNLTTVNADFWIMDCDNQVTLYGLQGLTSINGSLFILQNDGLVNFFGLHSLNAISGSMTVMLNSTLQDISQVSNLTSVNGISLQENQQLNSLNGLQGITSVTGSIDIQGNNINSCSGLNNLTSAQSLRIIDEQALTTLNGLQNLQTISHDLQFQFCPLLQQIDGVDNLISAGNLKIEDNFTLSSLPALDHAISLNNLLIENNSSLSICAVEAVCDFIDSFTATITNNNLNCNSQQIVQNMCATMTQLLPAHCGEQLTTFDELFFTETVAGATEYEFKIWNVLDPQNPITGTTTNTSYSLDQFGIYELGETYEIQVRAKVNGYWSIFGQVCQLYSPINVPTTSLTSAYCSYQIINFNDVFTANPVAGATQYEFEFTNTYNSVVTTSVSANNSHSLQDAGISDYNQTYEVRVRAYIDGTWGDYDLVCQLFTPTAICPPSDVEFYTQAEVDYFLVQFPNCTEINGYLYAQGSNITDLTPLSNIEHIHGQLAIFQSGLTDLTGLESLHSITSPYTPGLYFMQNPDLQSISQLFNLTSLNQGITFGWNPSLTSFQGLEGLTSIPGSVQFTDNGNSDMSGFDNITSVEELYVVSSEIVSLNGLESLVAITNGDLTIGNNLNLTDIHALDHPITISQDLIISANPLLSQCNALAVCDYISSNTATIANNSYGCNSQAEVQTTCEVPYTKLKDIHCGEQLTTFNEVFYADPVPGATEYQFKFTDVAPPNDVVENVWTSTGHHLGLVNLLELDKTYDVQVRAKVNGVWGLYGQVCQIHSPNDVPTTQLKTAHCGEQLTTFNEVFYADAVSGATQYEFLFIDTDNIIPDTYSPWTSNGHHLQIPGLLEANKTYNVQVRAYVDNTWGTFGPVCQIHSPTSIPLTQLIVNDCGKQLTTFNEIFKTETVNGATQYEFKFTNTVAPFTETTNTWTNTSHSLILLGLLDIGQTYDVQTRAQVNGVWGDWGPICQIHSPIEVPTTQLKTIHCGEQLTTFNEVFKTETVSGASMYEFMFTNTVAPFTVTTNTWSGTGHSLQLLGLYDLNQTYDVQTRAQVNGVWGAWGPVCQIHSPTSIPNTNIYASDCGTTMSSYNEVFKCDAVAGADLYKFRFYDGSSYSYSDRTINTNTLTIAGLLLQNVTYQVDVMARINGVWGTYDQACSITSPPTPPTSMPGQDFDEPTESTENSNLTAGVNEDLEIELVIYPNPAREQFTLSTEFEGYSIQLYSTNGQLVYSSNDLSGVQSIDVSILDPGLYLLHIINKDMLLVETEKITVIK